MLASETTKNNDRNYSGTVHVDVVARWLKNLAIVIKTTINCDYFALTEFTNRQ